MVVRRVGMGSPVCGSGRLREIAQVMLDYSQAARSCHVRDQLAAPRVGPRPYLAGLQESNAHGMTERDLIARPWPAARTLTELDAPQEPRAGCRNLRKITRAISAILDRA